jgi:hypothetical protein
MCPENTPRQHDGQNSGRHSFKGFEQKAPGGSRPGQSHVQSSGGVIEAVAVGSVVASGPVEAGIPISPPPGKGAWAQERRKGTEIKTVVLMSG